MVSAASRSEGRDGDGDPLCGVVRITAEVPLRIQWLDVPRLVVCAADQLVIARLGRVPSIRPPAPGVPPGAVTQHRLIPALSTIDAQLNADDLAPA